MISDSKKVIASKIRSLKKVSPPKKDIEKTTNNIIIKNLKTKEVFENLISFLCRSRDKNIRRIEKQTIKSMFK